MTRPVDVSGGTGGIAVRVAELHALAGAFGDAAAGSGLAALQLHGYLLDPAITAVALVGLSDYACFEADLLDALDGLRGLTWTAAELGALDAELRAAAAAYAAADELRDVLQNLTGLAALPAAVAFAQFAVLLGRDPMAALQLIATLDPQIADVVVDALGLPGRIATLSAHIPDGHARVASTGIDRGGSAGSAPHDLEQVLADLAQRDDGPHGAVDVRIVTDAQGTRHVIVDITGTKTFTPARTSDVTSLVTNGKALTGQATTYEAGVLAAMRRAGVRPSDDVLLVGHSEGGMVAVTAARDAVRSGEFRVTHVITAGSPVGLTAGSLPSSVKVLAIENRGDVVPHLDGRVNPDKANVTTVVGDRGDGTITGDHSLRGSYVPLAGDTDHSGSTSVRDFIRSARGFLTGTHVETKTYVISRTY